MIAIYVVSCIVCFWLGFFICALFKVDGQAPRSDTVDDAVYQHMEDKDE